MTFDVDGLRRDEFPWAAAGEAIYLNTASTGPLPRRSVEALDLFNQLRGAPHRLSHDFQFGTLVRSRELIARLIHADASEIALTTNTSFGLNIAATSLPLGKGDVVLGVESEFPANVYPWMAAARTRGFEFELLPLEQGLPSQARIIAALDRPGVRVLALSWVGFSSGFGFDLATVGAECRRRGITFVVDAIQGLGPRTLDVGKCGIDILSCGAQKWLLSPWGTGFVYIRRELIGSLDPVYASWMGVRGSDDFAKLVDYDLTWRDDARRFEFITLPFQDFAGLNASLGLFFEIGPDTIASYTESLADYIVEWARANDVAVLTPTEREHRAGIVSLKLDSSADVSAQLHRTGVVHSLREGAIRLAPYFFNTRDELDAVFTHLQRR